VQSWRLVAFAAFGLACRADKARHVPSCVLEMSAEGHMPMPDDDGDEFDDQLPDDGPPMPDDVDEEDLDLEDEELSEDDLDDEADLAVQEGDDDDDEAAHEVEEPHEDGETLLATEEEEDYEDDEEDDGDDVEASLDVILKSRLVVSEADEEEDEEDEDEEEADGDERGEVATRVLPKQPGEFVCQSCFLVKNRSQLADGERQLCRDCV
jgi:Domain of unknown function (DUF4193)